MNRISVLLLLSGACLLCFGQSNPSAKSNNYAQKLVDEEAAKHPEVIILAIHAKSATDSAYPIIAWAGPTGGKVRIGKKADDDDMRVVNKGTENLEVGPTGDRYEVELPLQDANGKTIGALGVVFPYKKSDNRAEFKKTAEEIRDDMRAKIPSAAKLNEAQ